MIFTYAKAYPPATNSTLQFPITLVLKFMTSSENLNISDILLSMFAGSYCMLFGSSLSLALLEDVDLHIPTSRCQHGSPWPSLATRLNRPSLRGSLRGYILYRHRAVAFRFLLVVLPLLVHVKGSTGVYHLWVRPYFSSSVLHV